MVHFPVLNEQITTEVKLDDGMFITLSNIANYVKVHSGMFINNELNLS